MEAVKVHLNIGSNLGNRLENIAQAINRLRPHTVGSIHCSPPFFSRAWGYDSGNDFINMGVTTSTLLTPEKLLNLVKRIEKEISPLSHRDENGLYADRFIDIDIIAIEERKIESVQLIVPHPLMHLREFVLRPMAQTWPDWKHPITGKTINMMLNDMTK